MTRVLAAALVAVVLIGMGPLASHAHAVSSGDAMSPAEVVAIDRAQDGNVVIVEGEVIGEHLRARGGGRWLNILGDEVGLGIWVTNEMAESIEYFGDHRHDGDTVRVVGVVNIACEQHAGEFDVHAESLAVIEPGGPREMQVEPVKGVVGAAGIALALVLWRLYRHRRERRML